MVDKKKTSVAWFNLGLYYPPENSDFSFWAFVFLAVYPQPNRGPTRKTFV